MTALSWDKPKRARTPEEHAAEFSADGAPPGVYVPNMSDEDAGRWKAKVTGQKRGVLQVEIRKSFSCGSDLVLIVCLDGGYTYKGFGPHDPGTWKNHYTTEGINIHMALNGPLRLTFDEFAELSVVVAEARAKLREMETISS